MKVVLISPHYPAEMPDFTRGLADVGAQIIGVGDTPREGLPAGVRQHLAAYLRVSALFDEGRVLAELVPELRRVGVDRIEALWEPCVLLAARLREALGVPGMSVDTAMAFRDKTLMRARLAAAGLRVPKNARARSAAEALAAARAIGYPICVKPVAGAGSADTHGCVDEPSLRAALSTMGHVPELSVEEFITGDEFTYDTVCVEGVPAFESVAQYHPRPLEARSQEWISPAQIVFRDPHHPALMDGVRLGRGVLKALGMGTGFTHMEWFRKPDGEVVFGEIAARFPGAKLVDQMNYANDFDVFREWARAVCWHSFEATPQRRYHVAAVFKRALGRGRITRVEGLGALRARCGPRLIAEELLPIGHPRRDWKKTLLSDGCVIMRDPDYAACLDMMQAAVRDLRVYAE
ncbi:MAG: hypothetical protein H6713_13465 [Myxococcales bacterium]|nr:hypothetical protein [Myxococcales bacterium]MCB9750991.1 hypothetical protein [Myxococcales bacterium]